MTARHRMAPGRSTVYDLARAAHSPIVRVRPLWQRFLIQSLVILEAMVLDESTYRDRMYKLRRARTAAAPRCAQAPLPQLPAGAPARPVRSVEGRAPGSEQAPPSRGVPAPAQRSSVGCRE